MINDVKEIESPLGIRATRQTFSSRLVPVSRCVAQHRLRNFSLALYRLYILECGCSTLQYTLCTPTPLRIRAHGRIARATMTCYDRAVVRNETIDKGKTFEWNKLDGGDVGIDIRAVSIEI